MSEDGKAHAERLESLWQGSFGDDYTQRNSAVADHRLPFWKELLSSIRVERVLEVGCNLGANLKWITTLIPGREVVGVDVNESALQQLRATIPSVNSIWSRARELPFRDGWFDLAYTTGVLIHQPPDMLPDVMAEIVRCSRRYVLAGEYFAETVTEVPYRGQPGALYKMDFGGRYLEKFPSLRLVKQGFLPKSTGWDDLTWWLLEKK